MKNLFLSLFLTLLLLGPKTGFCEENYLQLHFLIDEEVWLHHTLLACKSGAYTVSPYQKDLQNFYGEFSSTMTEEEYNLLSTMDNDLGWSQNRNFHYKEMRAMVERAKNYPLYHLLMQQTQDYLKLCQQRWEESLPTTLPMMQELSGIPFHDNFTVFITHPGLRNGSSAPWFIFWGNSERWPNYTVVYLWHEIFHTYVHGGGIGHAAMQLLIDNELRVRLNKEASYPPFEGHRALKPLMEAMYEDWKLYLASEKKDFRQWIELMIEKYKDLEEALKNSKSLASTESVAVL